MEAQQEPQDSHRNDVMFCGFGFGRSRKITPIFVAPNDHSLGRRFTRGFTERGSPFPSGGFEQNPSEK